MTLLQIEAHDHDGLAHVVLTGELDLSTIQKVEKELTRVEGEGPEIVALDLSRLTFLDSSGLRVIVSADQRARRENRRFVVLHGLGGPCSASSRSLGSTCSWSWSTSWAISRFSSACGNP